MTTHRLRGARPAARRLAPSRVLRHALSGLVLCVAGAADATEARLRFCLAMDEASHRFFLTDLFQSSADRSSLESALLGSLWERGIRANYAQCPLPEDPMQVAADHKRAADLNAGQGLDIVRWSVLP